MGGGRVVVTPLGGADPWMETKMPKIEVDPERETAGAAS